MEFLENGLFFNSSHIVKDEKCECVSWLKTTQYHTFLKTVPQEKHFCLKPEGT